MKLISMTDFVLEQRLSTEEVGKSNFYNIQTYINKYYDKVLAYSNFLKQPLTLSMFIPVDEDGNIWTHPPTTEELEWAEKDSTESEMSYRQKVKDYIITKDKVLFEGFSICNRLESVKCVENGDLHFSYDRAIQANETIENLVGYGLQLTETAKKQIFE